MKCPKCNYVSFDYNQICPKCNKDISVEQERLNIPAFKPTPPSLLGGVLGDAHPEARGAEVSEAEHGPTEILQESSSFSGGGPGLDDSQEIDLGLDLQEDKDGLELEGILEEPGAGIDPGAGFGESPVVAKEESEPEGTELMGTITMEPERAAEEAEKEEDQGEISLDLEEITLEGVDSGETAPTPVETEEKIEADLGDFTLEDAGVDLEKPEAPPSDTGELILDLGLDSIEAEKAPEEQDEITLNLEDLNVNETGELEIGKHIPDLSRVKEPPKPAAPVAEAKPEPAPDGGKDAEDDLSLLLSDDTIEIAAEPEGVETLDLENLDVDLDLAELEHK